jgi:hypothetical protein
MATYRYRKPPMARGNSGQWLVVVVVVVGLLFLVSVSAAALSSGIFFWVAGLPCLWGRLGMQCTPFCSLGALVRQAEELRDVLHIVCG